MAVRLGAEIIIKTAVNFVVPLILPARLKNLIVVSVV